MYQLKLLLEGCIWRRCRTCYSRTFPSGVRCRYQGGLSTGPKPPEGKSRPCFARALRFFSVLSFAVFTLASSGGTASAQSVNLTITHTGPNTGATGITPLGLVCNPRNPGTCVFPIPSGEALTLSANSPAPSTPGIFSGGTGSAVGCAASTCSFTINADSTLTADWNSNRGPFPTLTMNLAGADKGSVGVGSSTCQNIDAAQHSACITTYASGSLATLTAQPAAGSVFGGFSGACVSSTTTCTFTITGSSAVTATFNPSASVTTVSGTVSGTESSDGANTQITFSCKGVDPCIGIYTATLTAPRCSNSLTNSDVMSISGSDLAVPGVISGGLSVTNTIDYQQNPDGTCTAKVPRNRQFAFSGTSNGANGTFIFALIVHANGGGTLQLAGSFSVSKVSLIQVFPMVVTGAASVATPIASVSVAIQYRPQDVGTSGSVYVFALAPTSIVKGAALKGGAGPDDPASHITLKSTPSVGTKTGPLGCVLAQLNSAGQLTAVSASNLQAFLTGVLSAGGAAVNILNNISTATIQGSTFYVGVGTTGSNMISGGVHNNVVTVPGTQLCQPFAPQTGWWWDPTQRDRGYGIEVRGSNLFYTSFINNPSGAPSWMVASGPTALDGSLFQATLVSYANGQTLSGPFKAPTGPTSEGLITISTATATQGTMIWPSGTRSIERMSFAPNAVNALPQPNQPESGWWWNTTEPGRGYFIEWQKGFASVTGYMYDDAGKPVWYQAMASTTDPRVVNGTWSIFGNGYPLTQAGSTINRKMARLTDNFQPLSLRFSDATNGTLTLPGGRNIAITRLRF